MIDVCSLVKYSLNSKAQSTIQSNFVEKYVITKIAKSNFCCHKRIYHCPMSGRSPQYNKCQHNAYMTSDKHRYVYLRPMNHITALNTSVTRSTFI